MNKIESEKRRKNIIIHGMAFKGENNEEIKKNERKTGGR